MMAIVGLGDRGLVGGPEPWFPPRDLVIGRVGAARLLLGVPHGIEAATEAAAYMWLAALASLMSTPILSPPQSGILGMHKIARRPVALGDKIEIRPMMYVALSYDHRLVDGREAVTFLVRIKDCVEDPSRILFDI